MRVIRHILLGILSLAVLSCSANIPIFGDVGLTSKAEAKGYWTRKRVNGRWVRGHFPKPDTRSSTSRREKTPTKEREPETGPKKQVASVDPSQSNGQLQSPVLAPKAPVSTRLLAVVPAGKRFERVGDVVSVTYDVTTKTKTITYVDGRTSVSAFEMQSLPPFLDLENDDVPTGIVPKMQQMDSIPIDPVAQERLRAALVRKAETLRTVPAAR